MELEIVLLLVKLTAVTIMTASTHVQLLIKDIAVMEEKLE